MPIVPDIELYAAIRTASADELKLIDNPCARLEEALRELKGIVYELRKEGIIK